MRQTHSERTYLTLEDRSRIIQDIWKNWPIKVRENFHRQLALLAETQRKKDLDGDTSQPVQDEKVGQAESGSQDPDNDTSQPQEQVSQAQPISQDPATHTSQPKRDEQMSQYEPISQEERKILDEILLLIIEEERSGWDYRLGPSPLITNYKFIDTYLVACTTP